MMDPRHATVLGTLDTGYQWAFVEIDGLWWACSVSYGVAVN